MPRSTIWFEISGQPRQLEPRDFLGAVQANSFKIPELAVIEISIDMIHQQLAMMPALEPATIAAELFLVSKHLPSWLLGF